MDEITFNTEHYEVQEEKKVWRFGRWAQLETLLHEQVHLWQQNFGEDPVKPSKVYHNREFVGKCESLGLHPMPVVGSHTQVADGVFAQLMNELRIPRPENVPTIDWTKAGGKPIKRDWFRPEREKGRSTLRKWVCPDCGLSVRIGINSDPHLVHDVCSEIKGEKVFLVSHDGLTHTIYEGKNDDSEPKKSMPQVVIEMNELLKEGMSEDMEVPTVEGIAGKLGINKKTLYMWVNTDPEFSDTLERLQKVQKDDPFKTGKVEDGQVNAAMIALLLIETKDRHYKPSDL